MRREGGEALFVLQSVQLCCSTVSVAAFSRPLRELAARSESLAR
jgi:hypothetical protein